MLLSSGIPTDWGYGGSLPTGFGLQDPEFTQYRLSPFSLMRLLSSTGDPVYYPKANDGAGMYYSNITMGFGNYLLMPYSETLNSSMASKLLGINNTYGFQLTLTPVVTVSLTETRDANPLRLSLSVAGTGFPLANAQISYYLLLVDLAGGEGAFPAFTVRNGTTTTNDEGSALVEFPEVTDANFSYGFIAYAHLSGLTGVGYHERVSSEEQSVIPFVGNFTAREVLIAHSYDVHYFGPPENSVKYNSTFVILTEDFTLREVPLENATGMVTYGEGYSYGVVTLPSNNPGILVTTYRKNPNEGGVVMMPWGLGSLGFPITFGSNPTGQEWVATDTRQVLVNNVLYQAKLALWSLEGNQVIGQ
jgi:hypothetical protein